ncbi:UNVERIFIED_CONTAM: hypothetical protein PYX00_005171 [Menopon gallinae]|uniref:Dynein axonemal intermediate chain 4 n=1 Tax=Menopon gallinae TaxID=328185 RepID=A0AAW2HRE6_9NEOP
MSKITSYHNLSRQSNVSRKAFGSSNISQSSYGIRSTSSKHAPPRPGKKKKITQSALVKRGQYHVYDQFGTERTPKLLYDPDYQVLEEWQPTVLDYVEAEVTSGGSQTSLAKHMQSSALSYGSRNSHTISLQMSFTNIANVESYRETTKQLEAVSDSVLLSDDHISDTPPSAFRLKYVPSREFYPPHSKVPIVCKETESMTFFSLSSVVDCATTAEGKETEKNNAHYEYITEGRGKYARKINTAEQQTIKHINTTQCNYLGRKSRKNSSTWVTVWKIYDEYKGTEEPRRETHFRTIEDQWARLQLNDNFLKQSLIMERILGGPEHRTIQLIYKKAMRSDPFDPYVKFVYAAETLWTYCSDKVQNRAVSAIAINTLLPDIIAVGYGKFQYKESDKGFICIWNVKNPKNPERIYRFSSPVTCLDFAVWSPNMLAAGFLDGSLLVLDIKSTTKKILYAKDSVFCDTYEAIIFIKWWICIDIYGKQEERLMMTTADGKISQLRRRFDLLVPFQMMRTTRPEGKLKGISSLRRCEISDIPMLRFPAARSVVRYPDDEAFYLVSSEDGTIHKCSINYFTQHVDVFLAHCGPVYALKFSPFCNKIFLTCGADGAVRLWAWDITEPLITLTTGPVAVLDAAWSPRNSTIIMSISGPRMYIWDLTRKTYFPASTHHHPDNADFAALTVIYYNMLVPASLLCL